MQDWNALEQELDHWSAAARRATFWWRDDDAAVPTPALDRLLALAAAHDLPCALSVVPARTDEALRDRLADERTVTVLQHGHAHRNHEAHGKPESEMGSARDPAIVWDELLGSRDRLDRLYGPQFAPVLVPPWGRIDARVADGLAARGWRGLSVGGERRKRPGPAGLARANVHTDLIAWHPTVRFAGSEAVLSDLLLHLRARRRGRGDAEEPTGLMTHHLDNDAAAWDFLDGFFRITVRHPAVRWLTAREAFVLDA